MAGAPRFKVYSADGEYLAATKRPEEAAAVVAMLGVGATIRSGHAKKDIVWHEGRECQGAGDSFDHVAVVVYERLGEQCLQCR